MSDFDPALLEAPVEGVDSEAEYSVPSIPPPAGVALTVRFELSGDKGIEVKKHEKHGVFLSFRFCGTVTEGDHEGKRFFGYASSLPRKWANNSAWTHVFLRKCGYGERLKERLTLGQLKELLELALGEGHAIPDIKLSWSATYVPTETDSEGKKKYLYDDKVSIYKNYARFPWVDDNDHSKGKQHEFVWTDKNGDPHEITADVQISQFG